MHRPQVRGRTFVAISAALIVVTTVSGCGTLLNPYVRAKELADLSAKDSTGIERLEKVVVAAEKQREAYYLAISQRAKTRNALPLVLLPLSAMTLYRGITTATDAGRRMVLEMGLLGAAYYSTANWYLVAPRERIYLAGTLALSCAIHAAEPYLAAKSAADFPGDLRRLDEALALVGSLRAQLDAQVRLRVASNPLHAKSFIVNLAESQSEVARALVARGQRVATVGRRLQAQIGNIAGDLRFAVQRITDQVDRQIEATDQDPASVLRAAGSLGKIGADLAHVSALRLDAVTVDKMAPEIKKQTDADPGLAQLVATLDQLADANVMLMQAMTAVASFNATMIQAIRNAPRLDSCAVADVAGEIVVSPAEDNATLKTGVPYVFRVRAASGIPDAALSGAIGDSSDTAKDVVRILDKAVDGNVRVVRVLQDKPVQGHEQVTLDLFALNERGSGASKKVTLTLDTAPAPKPAPAAPAAPAAPPKATTPTKDLTKIGPKNADPTSDYETGTLTVGKLMEVQKALKVKADGDFGPITRAAIGRFVGGADPDTRLTAPLVDKILAGAPGGAAAGPATPQPSGDQRVGPPGANATSDYETKVLTVGMLKEIQKKLGEAPDGAFTVGTRAAIKQKQGGAAPDGRLTPALVEKILKGA